jgi:CRP/FNR family transcriptional regulator, nitrogen oxide reductase regulator
MMASPDICTVIAPCALFRNLSLSECEAVVAQSRLYDIRRGECFFQQGEESTMLYVITNGQVKLSRVTSDGQQVIVNYFGPGEGLGIIVALNETPYPVTAEAVEDSSAAGWNRDTLLDLMQLYPQLAINGMQMVGRRFTQMQNRFQEIATQRVEQRVARALLRLVRQFGRRLPEGVLIDMPLRREDLAQMTGTNLYSVSRILSKWESNGLIATGRKQVTLLKPHDLVALAEDIPLPGKSGDSQSGINFDTLH